MVKQSNEFFKSKQEKDKKGAFSKGIIFATLVNSAVLIGLYVSSSRSVSVLEVAAVLFILNLFIALVNKP